MVSANVVSPVTLTSPERQGSWFVSYPANVKTTSALGYLTDGLTIDLYTDDVNPWAVSLPSDLPMDINASVGIAVDDARLFVKGFKVRRASYSAPNRLSLSCKREASDANLATRIATAAFPVLPKSVWSLFQLSSGLSAKITVLQQHGFDYHSDEAGTVEVYPVESLWLSRRRSEGPFKAVPTDVIPLLDASGSSTVEDLRIRQNYDGAGIYANVHADGEHGVSLQIAANATVYKPETGMVDMELSGVWPNIDAAVKRLEGELARTRLEAETARINTYLRLDVKLGSIVAWKGRDWCCLSVGRDVAGFTTEIKAVRFR